MPAHPEQNGFIKDSDILRRSSGDILQHPCRAGGGAAVIVDEFRVNELCARIRGEQGYFSFCPGKQKIIICHGHNIRQDGTEQEENNKRQLPSLVPTIAFDTCPGGSHRFTASVVQFLQAANAREDN
jgi:hypothetical protein